MSGTWHPVHDNHAIDVMAAVISFAEPIPELVFKKVLKATEDAAFSHGLRSRQLISGGQMVLTLGVNGVQGMGPTEVGPQGRAYNSLIELSEDQPIPNRVAEQIQITTSHVMYRTWQYVSWTWQLGRMKELLGPSLSLAAGLVFFASQRLEYLDRFRFEGDIKDAMASGVLRQDSDKLAPHIFSRSDLWHSHTGAYRASNDSVKKVEQVHADAVDDPALAPSPTRWINLMTAREDRFVDQAVDQTVDGVFANYDAMHGELIGLLASVVTPEIAERIYLKGSK